MKKRILLAICLLASVIANAQFTGSEITGPPPPGFEGQCNCFTFTADSPLDPEYNPFVPLDPLSSSAPGYSYFWVWGDGLDDYEYQPSVPMTHCFNGNLPVGNHNVILHLTPRKKPLPESLNAIPVPILIVSNDDCDPVPPPLRASNISFNHNIKLGQKFVVIIDAETCNKPSDFRLTFQDALNPSLVWCTPVNPLDPDFTFGPNEVTFSLASGSKRYCLELQCNNTPALDLNEINFVLERNNSDDTPDIVDTMCLSSETTKMTITSNPFDPNIIYPSHGQNMSNCLRAGDRITYKVQFQNEGPGATGKVKLLVALPAQLDATSIRLESILNSANSNWPLYQLNQTPTTIDMFGQLSSVITVLNPPLQTDGITLFEIICNEMELQGLINSDDYQSTGFVTFSAVLLSDMVYGQDIATTSYVYFYNLEGGEMDSVQTNTAITSCKGRTPPPISPTTILIGIFTFLSALALYWFKFRKK